MPTFNINDSGVTVTDDRGDTMSVSRNSSYFEEAFNLAMTASWQAFQDIAVQAEEDDEPEDEMESLLLVAGSVSDVVGLVRGLIEDDIVSAEDLGLSVPATNHGHEHDLSQWAGSPIFYPTREMAREQSDQWGMFWAYHDFGPSAPAGYRYATVPRLSQAPTAPDGYDWVCLPREES